VLTPTASSRWSEPLATLAKGNGETAVPDRDLVLALGPRDVNALAQRFQKVREVLGSKKKARFNAVLSITTNHVGETQALVEKVLEEATKRWMLDEVITNTGKPSELYYLIRLRKTVTREDLITAVRAHAGDRISSADVELAEFQNGKVGAA
jgi:hypothetical protein